MVTKACCIHALTLASLILGSVSAGRAQSLPPPDPAQVRVLLDQLDHREFAQRQQAEQKLRDLGLGVVPLLREELRNHPTLEIVSRLENIIRDLAQLRWRHNLVEAQAETRRSGKMLLVVSALGKTGGFGSLAVRAFETKTLSDLEVLDALKRDFVLLWQDHLADNWYESVNQFDTQLPSFSSVQIAAYAEGRGSENLRIFFVRPDGRILSRLQGFASPASLLQEARAARHLQDRLQNGFSKSEQMLSWKAILFPKEMNLLQTRAFDPALLDRAAFFPEPLEPVLNDFAKRAHNPLPQT